MTRAPLPTLYDRDIPADSLARRRVGILGFGSQGKAHAQNLRDRGITVEIGLPATSRTIESARALGFTVATPSEIVGRNDIIMVLAPDELQAALFRAEIEPNLRSGSALAFAHGFAIHHQLISPP